jgi:hypothetical protein
MNKIILLSFLSLLPLSFKAIAMEDCDPSKYKTKSSRRCNDLEVPKNDKSQVVKFTRPQHPLIPITPVAEDYGDWKAYSPRSEGQKENTPPEYFDLRMLLTAKKTKI